MPVSKPSLKFDTLLYGGAVMAERLLGLLLLPLLTRRLSGADYGVWAQTAVASSVLMPLVLLGLPAAIVKFFAAGTLGAQRRRWMGRTLALAAGLFGGLGLVALAAPAAVAAAVYGSADEQAYVAVLALVLAADALFDLLIAYLRADFRMRSIAGLMVSRGALRLVFLGAALTLFDLPFVQVFGLFAALQLLLVTAVFALEWRRPAAGGGAANIGWRALLGFAAPLVVLAVLGSINSFADRFVLTHLLGLAAVAVYAAVSSVVAIANIAYTVLGFTLFPVLARMWAQGDAAGAAALSSDAIRVFLFLALPFVFWLASMAETVLPLIATRAYQVPGSVVLMLGLAVIGFGLYQIVLYLLLLAGKGAHATGFMLFAALLNTALNWTLVPRLGLLGAALAAALSNAALALCAFAVARRHARARFPWASAARIVLAAALAAAAAAAADRWLGATGWVAVALSLALVAALVLAADLLPGASVVRALVGRRAAAGAPA